MKKVLSLLVVVSMLVSILPATVSAAHWADEDVKYLVENGAIAEDDAMLQNLDTPIIRSQMVKVIVALLDGNEPIEGKEYFTDITTNDTHIAKAAENGFVNGFGDGTFRPNNPITRQDFFTIVGRAYELTGEATNEFTDKDSIADYAKPYVDALQSAGLLNGYGDGTIRPRGNITIAETIAVMHRVDAHVKANTPKEEEKPKPPGGGSGTSGSSGGGPGAFDGGGPVKPKPKPVILGDFTVEYTNDCASGVVAYVKSNIKVENAPARIALIRGIKNTGYRDMGGHAGGRGPSTYEIAASYNALIPLEEKGYAVPEYGPYKLLIEDTDGVTVDTYEIMVTPPESEDKTPPTLTIELPETLSMPLEVKVHASDNVELARLNYASMYTFYTTYEEKGYQYKIRPNNRVDITDGSFTVKDGGSYAICAMDTSGNCAFAVIAVDNDGDQPVSITYVSESISEYLEEAPDESEYDSAPPKGGEGIPCATLAVELENDFSGDYVATVKPEYQLNPGTTIVKSYLVAGSAWQWPAGGMKNIEAQLQTFILSGAVIEEQEGVFRVPDFGEYQCFVLDSNGDYGASEVISVTPPESEDTTPPTLKHFYFDADKGFPRTVAIRAADDDTVARVMCVNVDKLRGVDGKIEDYFKATVRGRKKVEGDSIAITEKGYYVICAMDTSGNCTYSQFQVKENGKTSTPFDLSAPIINYSLSSDEVCDGVVTITTDISDDHSVVSCGWFFMREYNEMPGGVEQVKRGYKLEIQYPNMNDLDATIETFDSRCGGTGSVCVISNYYKVKSADINRFIGNTTITAKENGVYFIYARDKYNNLKVARIDINNVKASVATSYIVEYGNFTSTSFARVAVSTESNKDAPIKKMLLVKDDDLPSVSIGDSNKYYACTDNFKIQKEIAAIEESGDYITEQDGYFFISKTGTYTLYIVDEFGNCSTAPINVPRP